MNARLAAGIAGAALLAAGAWFAWRPAVPADAGSAPTAASELTQSSGVESERSDPSVAERPGAAPNAGALATVPPAYGIAELVHDPEGDEKLLAHFQEMVPRIYEDVRTELGLDAAQNEILFALLVDQKMREFAQPVADSSESLEAYDALQAQFEREIEDQMGVERARAFANYRRTENARYEVDFLRRDLESASLPLLEAQRKAMIRTAIERGAYVVTPKPTGNDFDGAILQEAYARFEQRDRQLLHIAHGILDPAQVSIFERIVTNRQRAYDEMLRNASKLNSR